ncbi:MAG: hypothetical protein J6A48_09645, partial [Clostridia bacterium]|nr:hypothetical protein [Clostridia bacterium]
MTSLVITARSLGQTEEYLSLEALPIKASVVTLSGDGSADEPWQQQITFVNEGQQPWRGVIRISLPLDVPDPRYLTSADPCPPRYFLPGFLYGTNRGDAPLFTDSQTPRLRMEEEFPAFRWWMTRSD